MKIKALIVFSICVFLFSMGCKKQPKPDLPSVIKSSKNIDVLLEARYWRSLYAPTNAFELTFINNSSKPISKCQVIVNDKYTSSIKGLQVKKNKINKFVVQESDEIAPSNSVTIPFTKESGNLIPFKIKENIFFKPKTITLVANNDTLVWSFDVPLHESYF